MYEERCDRRGRTEHAQVFFYFSANGWTKRAVILISPAALLHPAILIFIRRNDLMPYRLPNLLISLK